MVAVADAPPWLAVKVQLRELPAGFSDTVTVFPERLNPSFPPVMSGTPVSVLSFTPLIRMSREAPAVSLEEPPSHPTVSGLAASDTLHVP